jgi:membrane protease YdiL (CAAX protease family)
VNIWGRTTEVWGGFTAFLFAVSVCFICWLLHIAGSYGPDFTISVNSSQLELNSRFVLITAATLLPAVYCFLSYPDCRSSLWKVSAGALVYAAALATGLALPLSSYPGTHYFAFPWGRAAAVHLVTVFASNLFLAPFWEEIVWRGCFLKKIRSFSSAPTGIVLMSLGWTVWHGGYITFLHSRGVPREELIVLPFTYFCLGIILGSVFELGRGSLWPCVILHAAFNASTVVYYSEYNRVSELSSYLSELIFTAIAASLFLWAAARSKRRNEAALGQSASLEGYN